ncbi:uncharacterized protein LOC126284435 [Schistocerca gregaria]|uniref:uncharacterized protein LOC126284435 n=1 Tax=Schistocerca gregaria TaxID=7010 RepID=UPI00211E047C|nr:uncharacterized protein LOC126284435 [Schistocerca gregaria]
MKSSGRVCSLLLLTMASVSSGRNAGYYFEEARFRYSPSRPEDALVLFIASAPPLICEPEDGLSEGTEVADFRLALPRGYSHYTCSFEGNATAGSNLSLIRPLLSYFYYTGTGAVGGFSENKMYCTTNSQLPDEYFQVRVQRPHEDRPVKCRVLNDSGRLYIRFPGYPTIVCQIGIEAGPYRFNLPGIDDPFKCAFRVYSEWILGDTHAEERLYRSLVSGLPTRVDGTRPRIVCFPHETSNGAADFQLLLQSGSTYDCSFPEAVSRYLLEPRHTNDRPAPIE